MDNIETIQNFATNIKHMPADDDFYYIVEYEDIEKLVKYARDAGEQIGGI